MKTKEENLDFWDWVKITMFILLFIVTITGLIVMTKIEIKKENEIASKKCPSSYQLKEIECEWESKNNNTDERQKIKRCYAVCELEDIRVRYK